MLRRSHIAVALAALTVTTVALAARPALHCIDKGNVKVEAVAKPGLGKFEGKVQAVSADENGENLVFVAELKNGLDMGLRNSHAREAFAVEKHNQAKLVVDKSKIKFPDDNQKVSGKVKGDLTLHGVTKPVTVAYTAKRTGSDIHIKDASFTFDYTNFGVEKICKLGVCVEPTVTVTVPHMKLREK